MAGLPPTTLVIVGLTGDLGRRYLLPAVGALAEAGQLPETFRLVGITRRAGIQKGDILGDFPGAAYLQQHVQIYQMDLDDEAAYQRLGAFLDQLEKSDQGTSQRLFYLSVPPATSMPIVQHLGDSHLASVPGTKLLMEKPFGTDLASAQELIQHVDASFEPAQIYRIDHYLAKEMSQNILPFRAGNALFRQTWDGKNISHIDVIASEALSIEGRATFYEQSGALRDLIQSHLLQLVALTLAELSDGNVPKNIPAARLRALQQLQLDSTVSLAQAAVRGQYRGYPEQAENLDSQVETFAALQLVSTDPRWARTKIRVITGKSLAAKTTEVRITFRTSADSENETTTPPQIADQLVLRIQPDTAIEFGIRSKTPGFGNEIAAQTLALDYARTYAPAPDAYERVILDAILGDNHLFVTADEVLATWQIVAPVQEYWATGTAPLVSYEAGAQAMDLAKAGEDEPASR